MMTTKVKVLTPQAYANVRCDPNIKASIVGRVTSGQIVTQTGAVKDGWTQLVDPNGWVFPGVDFVDLPQAEPGTLVCDGMDSPVGTEAERATAKVYPGHWFDANKYGTLNYYPNTHTPMSYHTGSDLNLNNPHWNADKGMPLYAVADGVVTTCAKFPVWGWLIIIRHDALPDGTLAWSRYAHMERIDTAQTARVKRGHILGTIGNANNPQMAHHLHFDIVLTTVLEKRPEHWPKLNKSELERHYVDPRLFIEQQHYLKYAGG